jgi:hypothetical protein
VQLCRCFARAITSAEVANLRAGAIPGLHNIRIRARNATTHIEGTCDATTINAGTRCANR